MVRSKEGQGRHDAEVLRRCQEARRLGWSNIFVDLPGFAKPPVINGFIPDVHCVGGFKTLIIEVETSDTLSSHSLGQHIAFRNWAQGDSWSREFLLVTI